MWDASFALAHDPPKCKRFGEEIMRSFNNLARDRTQNRNPLLRIARARPPPALWVARRSEDGGSPFDAFTPLQGAVTDKFKTTRRQAPKHE
jgi:hypothetical protein